MKIRSVKALGRYTVEWEEDGRLILSRRDTLFVLDEGAGEPRRIGRVSLPWWKQVLIRNRLLARLLRLHVYNAIPLANGDYFVSFAKEVGTIRNGDYRRLGGIGQGHRILRSACTVAANGSIYWGEYLDNSDRDAVHIYRYTPGEEDAEPVYEFAPGEIRHVHGIYQDPYAPGTLWCLSGDLPDECRIMRTSDYFASLEVVGSGDETYRAVSMLFREDAIYYGMDAEFRQNHVFRMDRSTHERQILADVDGPVYYSRKLGEDLLFAVTAELCPSQQRGEGAIWHVAEDDRATCIFSAPKDIWKSPVSVKYFQPGTFSFPGGPSERSDQKRLYFTGVGLKGLDQQTLELRL